MKKLITSKDLLKSNLFTYNNLKIIYSLLLLKITFFN